MTYIIHDAATPADYEATAAICNRIQAEPTTGETMAANDAGVRAHADMIFRRVLATDEAGRPVGYAVCSHLRSQESQIWFLRVLVDPDHRGRGAGTALYRYLEAFASENDAKGIETQVTGGDDASVAWAERRGFVVRGQRTESVLDLTTWDPAPTAGHLDQVRASGLQLLTLGDVPESLLPEIFATEVETMRDHPEYNGQDQAYETWLHWVKSSTRPPVWALAMDGERIAGYSCILLPTVPGAGAYTDYTCVRRDYRGRGVALAVKLLTIEAALAAGARHMRTNNNPENGPMLAVNQKLGYQMVPGPRRLEKTL